MRRGRGLALLVSLGVLVVPCTRSAIADEVVSVRGGFSRAGEYREWPIDRQKAYVAGAISGMLTAPLFLAAPGSSQWLNDCVAPMALDEVHSIVNREVERAPEMWQLSMNLTIYNALVQACGKPPSPAAARPAPAAARPAPASVAPRRLPL